MWPFGERFPYSDTHELNLDWIIKTIKEVSTQFPDLIKEVNNKLNKAINAGNPGDILVNIGNNKTEWQNFANQYTDIIIDAVNEWLDDHPEATTTVQDASLTIQKMTEQTAYTISRKESGLIAPVYIGDYITNTDYLPSACVLNNGVFVCVNAPTDDKAISQGSGLGKIALYDVLNNVKLTEYNVLVGHGNSIAFDGTYYYIAPIWEYTADGKTFTNNIYKYNTGFALVEEIVMPMPIMGLSFDQTTNTLYALDYSGFIYKIENDIATTYSIISNWNTYYSNENISIQRYYNQDIAVNNGEFYVSSPFGNILHGKLISGNSLITDYMQMFETDSANRFTLGELEGFEFVNGHLYAVVNVNLPHSVNAFVMEMPVNMTAATSPAMPGQFNYGDDVIFLDNDTVNKFSLNTNEIRSVNQLHARKLNNEASQLIIKAGATITEMEMMEITAPGITIVLNGIYACDSIRVNSGELNIQALDSGNKLTLFKTNNYLIYLRRNGSLKFSGNTPINTDTPNIADVNGNLIAMEAGNMGVVNVGVGLTNLQNVPLRVADQVITSPEIYVANNTTIYMPHSFTVHSIDGFISNAAKDLHAIIKLPKKIKGTVTATGTIVPRGIQGYLDSNGTAVDLSTLNIVYYILDAYTLEMVITKQNSEAFTNTVNNTPVIISGTINIAWA